MQQKKGRRKKAGLVYKFFSIVIGMVFAFLFCLVIALFIYGRMTQTPQITPSSSILPGEASNDKPEATSGIINNLLTAPEKTNIIIAGTDAGDLLADVIIVGCFERDTGKINLISIPRDTYTVISPENVKVLQDAGRHPPSSGVVKMNAVHSYAGREMGMIFLQQQVEELLGISIDYYAEMDLAGFRNIVDAVGGIDMVIPKGGFYYTDSGQNLVISVPEGKQHLYGKDAEGVVRYRDTYARGDLQRIEMQHTFMAEFFSQVLNKETLMSNAPSLLSSMLNYVKTDFGIEDAPKYLKYVKDLKAENLTMQTLPGVDKTVNGASYFMYDEEETKALVKEFFYAETQVAEASASPSPLPTQTLPADVSADKLRIQILNGGASTGAASDKSTEMRRAGMNVINTGNYSGTTQAKTRLMVRVDEHGKHFTRFFKNPVIIVDEDIQEFYDVVIILGTEE